VPGSGDLADVATPSLTDASLHYCQARFTVGAGDRFDRGPPHQR
jgi:hypothetical protein